MGDAAEVAAPPRPRRDTVALAVVAAAVLAFVAWRSTLGVSLFDDAHYVVMPLRLAQGVRPLAGEWTLQVFGFILPAIFARAWLTLFGVTGIALALRLFYVVFASAAWYAGFRALRPSFGALPAALSMAVPLLAPPYGIFMASYNTLAEIGFVLAAALGLAALRSADRRLALAAGAALGLAAVSYPPLALAALAFTVAFAVLAGRGNGALRAPAAVGAAAVVGAAALWVAISASPAQIATAIAYSRAVQAALAPASYRLAHLGQQVPASLFQPLTIPLWVFAALACIRGRFGRVAGFSAALIPVAALLPAFAMPGTWGRMLVFGTTPPAYLIYVTLAGLLPVAVHVWRADEPDLRTLLALTLPVALVASPLVAFATNSGWNSGLAEVGAAPLTVAVVAGLARLATQASGRWAGYLLAAALLACQIGMLATFTFDDAAPAQLSVRVSQGAFAGLATTPGRIAEFERIAHAPGVTVTSRDRVLAVGGPGVYLLVPGVADTNAAWVVSNSSDSASVDYIRASGVAPDLVYVLSNRVVPGRIAHDPLLVWVEANYSQVATVPSFAVYRKR